ncbi:haloacid dehalogenase type II [Enterovirga aerilata]|uniref:(S)-2-haloacid dehalogenase n=1 Tax=Enterovirga aerilata TaxID=2730920 RepID=A0A849I2G3_9HYPH|nr:haloacid dehalogenase type II [Enterovirga sp. DB1703]
MPGLGSVRALAFDVFGTVVDWRSGVARDAAAILGARGLDLDWGAFADRWRALYQPSLERVRSGERPWTRLDDLHRESLLQVLEEFGARSLSEAEIEDLNRAWHRLDPWPDAVEGLGRLKRRYVIATLSNGNVSLLVDMAKRAGLPWDAVLGAEVARAYKPLPESYLTTARLLDCRPEECLMVAAHHHDLVAARSCGFRTAYVHRPREFGPAQKDDLPAEHGHDLVVADFLELADALGA